MEDSNQQTGKRINTNVQNQLPPSLIMRPSASGTQIKVLSKTDRRIHTQASADDGDLGGRPSHQQHSLPTPFDLGVFRLKPEREARRFKLIDDREWNIVSTEPPSETMYFTEGHSAMSVVSVIGPAGAGKSSLLNSLAGRDIFGTHHNQPEPQTSHLGADGGGCGGPVLARRHMTRGIDIFSTYHRLLLDCQPLNSSSVMGDFLTGRSSSQFAKNTLISDPLTSCHMISLQLATFLIATSDHVILMLQWLVDVHLLKLLSSAIMLVGEDNLRAKFIIFSKDKRLHEDKFRMLIDKWLGPKRVAKFVSNERQLYANIAPYSSEKCELYQKDPSTFTGKHWLSSCQRLWNSTIKASSMFSDYALEVYNSNNCIT